MTRAGTHDTGLTSPWDDDPLHAPAFWGFVHFAAADLIDQFEAESGPLRRSRGGIDAMIDCATGFDRAEAQRFVDWCLTIYGTPDDVRGGSKE